MVTMAHGSFAGLDERLPSEMSEESRKVGSLSIAELRSVFQKSDVAASGNAAVRRSPPTRPAHGTPAGPPSTTVKDKLQKFEQSPPLSLKNAATASVASSSPKRFAPRIGPEKARDAVDDESSASQEDVARTKDANCDKKPKPPLPLKTPKASLVKPSSPYKVPKPIGARPVLPFGPPDTTDGQIRRLPEIPPSSTKDRPRPNPSHLSSLISEIQQQHLQQQIHKEPSCPVGDDVAKEKEEEELPPAPRQVPPVGPPPVPLPRLPPISSIPSCPFFVPDGLDVSPRSSASSIPLHPRWQPRLLPSVAELGPPPTKPPRPPKVRLLSAAGKLGATPPLPQRNPTRSTSAPNVGHLMNRTSKPVPPPPSTPLPAEPSRPFSSSSSFAKESDRGSYGPTSPIPEYTEEEELGELYDDAGSAKAASVISSSSSVSHVLQTDELYQDGGHQLSNDSDDLYEDVGIADKAPSEPESFAHGAKLDDRKKKDDDKKMKKMIKENEKRQREIEKLRKKFKLTGNEVALDMGIIKVAWKGRRKDDLGVRQGETISILRISDNPVGKWLVQNEEGRVGYVDLTNIEVMSQSRVSIVSCDDLSEVYADDENSEEVLAYR